MADLVEPHTLNLTRPDTWWTDTPLDRPRTSHLARLDFGLAA